MKKIHFYSHVSRESFSSPVQINARCGFAEDEIINRMSSMTYNPLYVTCKKCIKIIAPEIKEKFNV